LGRYLALLGLAIVCCAVTGRTAGNEPTLGISIVAAGQEGPVEIVGFKPLPEDPVNIALHVHNVSNKATVDYWVEPLIRNAQGALWNYSNGHAAYTPGSGKIPPGGEAWETNTAAPGVLWATVAKDLNSTCLRMTGVVIDVKFADGTSWTINPTQKQDALERADRESKIPACVDSPGSEKYLEQLDSVEIRKHLYDSYQSEEPSGIQSFSFSCLLHRVSDSSVHAICGGRGH